MRLTMRRMLPALLVVFAFSAVAATAAQAATEGPFFKVNGKRLASGESAELKIALGKQEFTLESTNGFQRLECEGMKAKTGAKLLGSTGKNSGKFEGAFEFTGCSWKTSGSKFKVGTIATEILKGEVVYESSKAGTEGTGRFWIDFGKGGYKAKGNEFGKIGEWSDGELRGGWRIELEAGSVGSEKEAVAFKGWQRFEDQEANYQEASGKLEEVHNNLAFEAGIIEAEIGNQPAVEKIELASGEKWGIYTKA
jgi:hypothetical protein